MRRDRAGRPWRRRLAAAMLAALAVAPCAAGTVRLDDSASQVIPPAAHWQWAKGSLRTGINRLEMAVRVEARIDTRAWAGRAGRIYMALPLDAGGPIHAQWESRGRLLGGRLVSGERALVFSGTIPGPVLADTLEVRLWTDARTLTDDARPLAFHFELDSP